MQKSKALSWFFPENIRRVKKQADSYFLGGVCSGNSMGKTWGLISLAIRALPHDLVTGGIPHTGSWQRSFPMSQLFTSGGQSIGVSASASVLPKNTQEWSPLGCIGWISLQCKGLSSLLQHHSSKASILRRSAFSTVPTLTSIHDHWKNRSLD